MRQDSRSGSISKGALVGIAVAVVVVLTLVCWTFWKMNVAKGEIALANRYEAQFNVVETTLDTMRKTIMNQHKCTKEWADNFIKVVAQQAAGRSGLAGRTQNTGGAEGAVAAVTASGGGTGFTFARESEALGIPQDLYMKLANAIEGKLAEFKRSQDVLTDVWQTHKTYCEDPYHNWLGVSLVGKVKPKPEMISSTVTKQAIETKVLDDNLL